jgi:hypothetical protein
MRAQGWGISISAVIDRLVILRVDMIRTDLQAYER